MLVYFPLHISQERSHWASLFSERFINLVTKIPSESETGTALREPFVGQFPHVFDECGKLIPEFLKNYK